MRVNTAECPGALIANCEVRGLKKNQRSSTGVRKTHNGHYGSAFTSDSPNSPLVALHRAAGCAVGTAAMVRDMLMDFERNPQFRPLFTKNGGLAPLSLSQVLTENAVLRRPVVLLLGTGCFENLAEILSSLGPGPSSSPYAFFNGLLWWLLNRGRDFGERCVSHLRLRSGLREKIEDLMAAGGVNRILICGSGQIPGFSTFYHEDDGWKGKLLLLYGKEFWPSHLQGEDPETIAAHHRKNIEAYFDPISKETVAVLGFGLISAHDGIILSALESQFTPNSAATFFYVQDFSCLEHLLEGGFFSSQRVRVFCAAECVVSSLDKFLCGFHNQSSLPTSSSLPPAPADPSPSSLPISALNPSASASVVSSSTVTAASEEVHNATGFLRFELLFSAPMTAAKDIVPLLSSCVPSWRNAATQEQSVKLTGVALASDLKLLSALRSHNLFTFLGDWYVKGLIISPASEPGLSRAEMITQQSESACILWANNRPICFGFLINYQYVLTSFPAVSGCVQHDASEDVRHFLTNCVVEAIFVSGKNGVKRFSLDPSLVWAADPSAGWLVVGINIWTSLLSPLTLSEDPRVRSSGNKYLLLPTCCISMENSPWPLGSAVVLPDSAGVVALVVRDGSLFYFDNLPLSIRSLMKASSLPATVPQSPSSVGF